jgi:hypothetical protein
MLRAARATNPTRPARPTHPTSAASAWARGVLRHDPRAPAPGRRPPPRPTAPQATTGEDGSPRAPGQTLELPSR